MALNDWEMLLNATKNPTAYTFVNECWTNEHYEH